MMKYTDQEILNGLAGNSKSYWETNLVDQYDYFVETHPDRLKYREELISAYSDSILAFLENVQQGRFKQEATIKTYLTTIFKNKYHGELRKLKTNKNAVHQTEVIDSFFHLSDKAKNKLELIINEEMILKMRRGLSKLNDKCRELLQARFEEGISAKQAATRLNYKSEGTVRTTQHRCLEKLKETYSKIQ